MNIYCSNFLVLLWQIQHSKLPDSFTGKLMSQITNPGNHFVSEKLKIGHANRMLIITPVPWRFSQINETVKHFQQTQIRQMVDDTPENLLICMEYCGTCPSLPFPQEPLLFCARGCSLKTVSKKSCNCPACPIYKKYGLQNLYFCETGKATERKEHKQKARA